MTVSFPSRVLLGVTGGIAAYKAAELVRRLRERGAEVQVVMTAGAQRFITPLTFQALSGRPVRTDLWDASAEAAMGHIELARWADQVLVAPASADFMARLAQGRADDLLATLCLATDVPIAVAPAMNRLMWANSATQDNVATLRSRGVTILGPGDGEQACGETGPGRMLEPDELLQDLIAFFQPKLLAERRVLITAGPTFEPIDPVRGITNLSSGKMGFALARAAREAGAKVTLVAGPSSLPTPRGVRRIDVLTAGEMYDAVMGYANRAEVFVAVAAVADWRVANSSAQKLKKNAQGTPPALQFEANPDILASVAAIPGGPLCVGFAAESENVIAHAQAKRAAKGVAMIIANKAQDALASDEAEVHLIDAEGVRTLARAPKLVQAREIIAAIARRLV